MNGRFGRAPVGKGLPYSSKPVVYGSAWEHRRGFIHDAPSISPLFEVPVA